MQRLGMMELAGRPKLARVRLLKMAAHALALAQGQSQRVKLHAKVRGVVKLARLAKLAVPGLGVEVAQRLPRTTGEAGLQRRRLHRGSYRIHAIAQTPGLWGTATVGHIPR